MTSSDDDQPLHDPAESLALIERERANLARDLTPDPRVMLWPWGLAWLIGFLALFLRFGPDGRVFVDLPEWLPLLLLLGLIVVAGIITGVVGARTASRVSGPTSRQGLLYGLAWAIAFTGLSTVLGQFGDALPDDKLGLLWSAGMVALTGALHMAGGAVWDDRPLFGVGAWISVVNTAGVLIGPGWHALIVGVAGGGGMIVAGLISWLKMR